MSLSENILKKVLQKLQKEDINKIERLALSKSNIEYLETDYKFQQFLVQVSPNIKFLLFTSLKCLISLVEIDQFNLTNFRNLQCLSVKSEHVGLFRRNNQLLGQIFEQICSLQNLQKLQLDLVATQLGEKFISEMAQIIPKFQKIDTFRLELGQNLIQDEGCEQITQSISKLTQLKELILGLENNQIGNVGFRHVFEMVSKLENLERLQIDFWNNQQDDNANEDIYDILKNSKVCQNLQEFRIQSDSPYRINKNPIKLTQSLQLFNSLRIIYLSLDTNSFNENTSDSLNQILTRNSKTLQTAIIEFLKFHDISTKETNNFINNIFQNSEQMKKLESLLIQFHHYQSYSSAFEFFQQIQLCPVLVKLDVSSEFYELQNCSLSQIKEFFERILNIPYLIEFNYAKYSQQLDFSIYLQLFQKDWQCKHYIDDNFIDMISSNLKKRKEREFLQRIQYLRDKYIFVENISYLDETWLEFDSENEIEEEIMQIQSEDIDNNLKEHVQNDNIEIEDEDENSSNQNNEKNEEQINKKEKIKFLSLQEQEEKLDQSFAELTSLQVPKLISYFITLRHFKYKQIELLRFTVYNKILSNILETQFSNSPHIKRNLWDLHLI